MTNQTSNTSKISDTGRGDPEYVDPATNSLTQQDIEPDVEPDRWWLLSTVDTAAIRARYRAMWWQADSATAVVRTIHAVPELCAEVDRLCRLLAHARYGYANLTAAARSALAALTEGESDPWWYLRDELGAQLDTPGSNSLDGPGGTDSAGVQPNPDDVSAGRSGCRWCR